MRRSVLAWQMSDGWPFCVAIGCSNAGKDLSGEAKRRYATGIANSAQQTVLFLGAFVGGKPSRSVCLCGPCWQGPQHASKRLREGRGLTPAEEMTLTSMEYFLSRCLEHVPLSLFVDIFEVILHLPCEWGRWEDARSHLLAVLADARKSSATVAHGDAALMKMYSHFLSFIKQPGVKGYSAVPELTPVLISLHAQRRDAIVVAMTALYEQTWQTGSQMPSSITGATLFAASPSASSSASSRGGSGVSSRDGSGVGSIVGGYT